MNTLGVVMATKLEYHTYTNEFVFHWVLHSYGFVPHQRDKLSKLQNFNQISISIWNRMDFELVSWFVEEF